MLLFEKKREMGKIKGRMRKPRLDSKAEKFLIGTNSEKETRKVGKLLGEEILKTRGRIILTLSGPLGSGKTTFLKGFLLGLGSRKRVTSPTFLIFKRFSLKAGRNFYHFDCFRLKSAKELFSLGLKGILREKDSILAIEWPEKILKYLPWEGRISLRFSYSGQEKRKIEIKFYG